MFRFAQHYRHFLSNSTTVQKRTIFARWRTFKKSKIQQISYNKLKASKLGCVVHFWIKRKAKLKNLQNGCYLLKYNAIQTHKNKQIH